MGVATLNRHVIVWPFIRSGFNYDSTAVQRSLSVTELASRSYAGLLRPIMPPPLG